MTRPISPLVIVQPGQKLSTLAGTGGDFADWMLVGMRWAGEPVEVVRPHLGEALPDPEGVGAVLVTGSGAMVTDDAEWVEPAAAWLRTLIERGAPVLGICFGHQLLAHALGGLVRDNPNGVEVGTVQSRLTLGALHDPLFAGLPTRMQVQASHRQSVIELPAGAERLAASDLDPNHAFRFGTTTWGIQFHPEFSAPITRGYIEHYRDDLEASGRSVERLLAQVEELPRPAQVLRRFADLVAGRPD